jgi:hypothetical protein
MFFRQLGCVGGIAGTLFYILAGCFGYTRGVLDRPDLCSFYVSPNTLIPYSVGPGDNRTVLGFLPTDYTYPTTGRAVAEDGSLWWQIQTPDHLDRFVWVADRDAHMTGSCGDNEVVYVDTPTLNAFPTATLTPTATATLPVVEQPQQAPPPEQPTLTPTSTLTLTPDPDATQVVTGP